MSPPRTESWHHPSRPRSEVANLRAGLALSVGVCTAIAVAVVAVVVFVGVPSAASAALLLIAAVLATIGLVTRGRPLANWVSLAALAIVVAMGVASPDTRLDVLVMGTYTVFFLAILSSSRRWGLAWIALGVTAMIVVVSRSGLQVQVGGVTIDVGLVAVLQMVVAGGWLWWAWHAALDEAGRRDARAAEQEQVIAEAHALQERTRAWRAAITRTHETILNDLRYVLRTPQVDRARLRDQLLTTRDRRALPPGEAGIPLPALSEQRLASAFDGELQVHGLSGDCDWLDEVEPVLAEIVRNISRHSAASRIDITVHVDDGVRRITVEDDGRTALDSTAAPGIGRSVVVGDALAALGAQLEEAPHRTVITIPRDAQSPPLAGRVLLLLLSIILVSSALGGSPQFLLLLAGASLTYLPVALAAFGLTALGVVTVLRRRSVSTGVVTLGALLAVVVTGGMAVAQPACAAAPLMLTTINLSINAFFAILLWARNRWAWLLALLPFVGVLSLDLLPGVRCPIQGADVLLSSAVLMPVLILLSWMSARSAQRWEAQDRQRWEAEITERARAEADLDLARTLGDSVDRAWAQMWEIADGSELNDARRRSLRTVEADIRASLQADPRTSGGFVQAARHVVSAAGAEGVPVHVRALRGSADPRPVDPGLVSALVRMVIDDHDSGASIHVFFDGYDDYLTVSVPAGVAARAGFVPGWTESFGACSAEAEYVADEQGPAAEVTVMVWRPSSVSAAPAVVG